MLIERWWARHHIQNATNPTPVADPGDPALADAVNSLCPHFGDPYSCGDPNWHFRWEGELQIVGLDATSRSVTDVRQRLVRLSHELALRHLPGRARRILAVVLVGEAAAADLVGWYARLDDDQGELGRMNWRLARRRVSVLAVTRSGAHRLFGGDRSVASRVASWAARRGL